MPVEDSPVHELVKRTNPIASCSNLPPMKDGYYATDRHYFEDGTYELRFKFVKHRMSKLCRGSAGQYIDGQWKELDECRECKRPRDTDDITRQRQLAEEQSPAAATGLTGSGT